jgi:L-threonylcarbamoyladenylate synthase
MAELAAQDPELLLPSFEDWGVAVARLLGLGDDLRAGIGDVDRAAAVVRAGGVLIHPTSTLYGLAGNALDPSVAARVRRIKGARDAPFLALVADADAAFALAAGVSDVARRLADAFWPGPLTLVLTAAEGLPGHVVGPQGTVAVRVDPHPFVRALVAAAGVPVLSTSANRTGGPAPSRAGDLALGLCAACDLVVTQPGALEGTPSTVVRIDGDRVEVLRQGAVPEEAIRRAAGG